MFLVGRSNLVAFRSIFRRSTHYWRRTASGRWADRGGLQSNEKLPTRRLVPYKSDSHSPPSRCARTPTPIKIKPTQVPGHLHNFNKKKQPCLFFSFHRFAGEFVVPPPPRRYFRLLVSFGLRRHDAP